MFRLRLRSHYRQTLQVFIIFLFPPKKFLLLRLSLVVTAISSAIWPSNYLRIHAQCISVLSRCLSGRSVVAEQTHLHAYRPARHHKQGGRWENVVTRIGNRFSILPSSTIPVLIKIISFTIIFSHMFLICDKKSPKKQ